MTAAGTAGHRFAAFDPRYDLRQFACGREAYDRWLKESAASAVRAGTAAVYLLVERSPEGERAAGYYAIAPTAVARAALPGAVGRGVADPVPGYLLAKLALDLSHQGDPERKWGTRLLADALEKMVQAADIGGGRLIVVDAEDESLVPFYLAHSFKPTGRDPLRLYMKIATARKALGVAGNHTPG